MPSMYVNVPKMEAAQRDTLAAKLFEGASKVLRGMDIHTYVNEYATLYHNGQPSDSTDMTVINVEAGPMPVEKIEVLGQNIDEAVKAVFGAQQGCTMVYHGNGLDHLSINGKLLKK